MSEAEHPAVIVATSEEPQLDVSWRLRVSWFDQGGRLYPEITLEDERGVGASGRGDHTLDPPAGMLCRVETAAFGPSTYGVFGTVREQGGSLEILIATEDNRSTKARLIRHEQFPDICFLVAIVDSPPTRITATTGDGRGEWRTL